VVGQPHRYLYLLVHEPTASPAHELFGGLARVDVQTGSLLEADLGEGRYAGEPLYAQDAQDPRRGWPLSVVFDGHQDRSEVGIWDANRLQEKPCCRLRLPRRFHGTWHSRP